MLEALRRGWRFRRLRSSLADFRVSRLDDAFRLTRRDDHVVDVKVTVATPVRRTLQGAVSLDETPLQVRLAVPLQAAADDPVPPVSWLDELRARVTTSATHIQIDPDRLELAFLVDPVIDLRILGAFIGVLDGLGRSGRAAWLGASVHRERLCPGCQVPLRARVGPHLEDECPQCRGTFFDATIAGPVLQERWGLTPAEVQAAADATGLGGACPACARELRPVLVGEVIGDVCAGCGAIWLDAGEREALLPG